MANATIACQIASVSFMEPRFHQHPSDPVITPPWGQVPCVSLTIQKVLLIHQSGPRK